MVSECDGLGRSLFGGVCLGYGSHFVLSALNRSQVDMGAVWKAMSEEVILDDSRSTRDQSAMFIVADCSEMTVKVGRFSLFFID
jgi:hypothetical protein